MDDSDLRRGKPAAQRLHGWIHVINATNTGQMAMWRMLKDYVVAKGPAGNRMYEKFQDMLGYTIDGQYIENKFIHDTKDLGKASEDLYFRICDSKTCYYTVYGPMQLGAIAAGQDDATLAMLKEIGKNAGVAFQIVDDILDMTADEKVFGKKNFGDLYEGKLTLMILHSYKSATAPERTAIDGIYRKKRQEKTEEDVGFLKDVIARYDGLGYARETARRYGAQANGGHREIQGQAAPERVHPCDALGRGGALREEQVGVLTTEKRHGSWKRAAQIDAVIKEYLNDTGSQRYLGKLLRQRAAATG